MNVASEMFSQMIEGKSETVMMWFFPSRAYADLFDADYLDVEIDRAQKASEEIMEFSRQGKGYRYDLTLAVDKFCFHSYHLLLGYEKYSSWCKSIPLDLKTLSRHKKIYNELTVQRLMPLESYRHLSPSKASSILKSMLNDEPTIPAVGAILWHRPPELEKWWKWRENLQSLLGEAR
ncbi:hypothetical protein ES708_09859 [subsurface metagenome]